MSSTFTLLSPLISNSNVEKILLGAALAGALVAVGKSLGEKIKLEEQGSARGSSVVPTEAPSSFGLLDMFVEAFTGFHDSVLGVENRKHIPFTGTLFLFIFFANLLGLIPGLAAITTTIWVNVGMSLIVFVYFNYQGVKAHGAWGYLKHFFGPMIYIAPLFFFIEIISTLLRILTLNLRLYWNITADHVVLEVFTEITPYVIPVAFYLFGTFVAFMQAFVFTMLTMVYILLATVHGEEHGHGEHHDHGESQHA